MAISRSRGTISGSYSYSYSGNPPTGDTRVRDVGIDILDISVNGYPNDHPFQQRGYVISGLTTTGSGKGNPVISSAVYSNYPSSTYLLDTLTTALPVGTANGAALFAATNPTRAAIQVPVALFELRELPMMVHQAFSLLTKKRDSRYAKILSPRGLAQANLAVQFGWMPLVSDIRSMFDLTDLTAKRAKEFEKLRSSTGLKRRVDLGSNSVIPSAIATSVGGLYSGSFDPLRSTPTKHSFSWGVARWRPSQGSPYANLPPSPFELKAMLTGFKSYQQVVNLWDALPWTWLIDWFTNFGDILQATQGRHIATPVGGVIMTTTIHTDVFSSKTVPSIGYPNPATFITFSGGVKTRWFKQRALATASVQAYLPDLSGRQLSILGSLAITKAR